MTSSMMGNSHVQVTFWEAAGMTVLIRAVMLVYQDFIKQTDRFSDRTSTKARLDTRCKIALWTCR